MKAFVFLLTFLLIGNSYASQLKVLTFNIGAIAPFGKVTNPITVKRVQGVCDQLRKSDHDIVLLQEVWTVGYRRILKDCGFPYSYSDESEIGLVRKLKESFSMPASLKWIARIASAFLPTNYGFDKGLMILSRHPFVQKRSYRFKENGSANWAYKDGEFPVSKGALFVTIDHSSGKRISLVNTHLVSTYEDHNYDDQRESQLNELITEAFSVWYDEPLIVGGDLNMELGDPVWERTRGSLLNSFKQADLDYQNLSTYPDRANSGQKLGVIDHLFSIGKVLPIKGGLLFDKRIPCGKRECFPSDHLGLYTIYDL